MSTDPITDAAREAATREVDDATNGKWAETWGRHVQLALDSATARELRRWQDGIRDMLMQRCGSNIDGSGCDSGDPLDFTIAEIEQAFSIIGDAAEAYHRALRTRAEQAERERDEVAAKAKRLQEWGISLQADIRALGAIPVGTTLRDGVATLRTRLEEAEKTIATLEALDTSACDHIETLKTRLDTMTRALEGMLQFFDHPKPIEWATQEAYLAAVQTCDIARSALNPKPESDVKPCASAVPSDDAPKCDNCEGAHVTRECPGLQFPPSPAPACETATPRTEVEKELPSHFFSDVDVVPADFARQLERELTAALAERDEARNQLSNNLWSEWEIERAKTIVQRDTALRELAEAKADTRRIDWLEKREITNLDGLRPTIRAAIDRAALDSALSREAQP